MATPKSGNLINFYLRESGSNTAYKSVVCVESSSFESTSNVNERVTKCGTLKSPGVINATKNVSGVVDFAVSGNLLSYKELLDWHLGGTVLDFVIGDAASGATLVDISGTGFIQDLSIDDSADESIGFDMTFNINGTPVNNL